MFCPAHQVIELGSDNLTTW